jgi:hypothetical protein
MTFRTHSYAAAAVAALAIGLGPAVAFADPVRVPLDQESTVGGVGVGCTGIGQTKNDPKWRAYSVKLEFADAQRALLANEVVTLSDDGGAPVLQVACEGPWVLLKLPAGKTYQVEAKLAQSSAGARSTSVKAPAQGQATFVLIFPDAH